MCSHGGEFDPSVISTLAEDVFRLSQKMKDMHKKGQRSERSGRSGSRSARSGGSSTTSSVYREEIDHLRRELDQTRHEGLYYYIYSVLYMCITLHGTPYTVY